jgi:hypothetical protein
MMALYSEIFDDFLEQSIIFVLLFLSEHSTEAHGALLGIASFGFPP